MRCEGTPGTRRWGWIPPHQGRVLPVPPEPGTTPPVPGAVPPGRSPSGTISPPQHRGDPGRTRKFPPFIPGGGAAWACQPRPPLPALPSPIGPFTRPSVEPRLFHIPYKAWPRPLPSSAAVSRPRGFFGRGDGGGR